MANALKFQWSPDEAIEKLYKHGLLSTTPSRLMRTHFSGKSISV